MKLSKALNPYEFGHFVPDKVYLYAEYPFTTSSNVEFLWGSAEDRDLAGDDVPSGYAEFGSVKLIAELMQTLDNDIELVIDVVMEVMEGE